MEPIDAASERFQQIAEEIRSYRDTVITETDTRVKVIDRIFVEVLGWEHGELLTEDPAVGGFADYNFRIDGRSRLIVEAKRDGALFPISGARTANRGYKLNGPVFRGGDTRAGIDQAIRYCGAKNAELACLTNGQQWIVFRGNRLGDGKDTIDGMAFVFDGLDSVAKSFAFFYELLAKESVRAFEYRPHFQDAEGRPIRTSSTARPLVRPGSERVVPASELLADMDRVMASFFQRLTGDEDPDMLSACFVETRESNSADRSLARISADLLGRIQDLDTESGGILTSVIDRAARAKRNEFVILVGTKGAGKTTFITRFFRHVLRPEVADKCIVTRVNMADFSADPSHVIEWLQGRLLEEAEAAIFDNEYPEFDDIRGMFFDEYTRLMKGPWATQYETNKAQFQIDFGKRIEETRRERPHDYIEGLLRHVAGNRKKLPVMVFDNADHFPIEFQESVYQYARSLYESTLSLVILPITDRTSWQMSRHGALQSFEHVDLFLPTPPTDLIIKKRIEFLRNRIAGERMRPDRPYFVGRGITLSMRDLTAFTETLQEVFLQTADVSDWIGNLANHDVRRALDLARLFVTSPHLKIDDLLKAFIAGSAQSVPGWRALKALVRQQYDYYPVGKNRYVQNVFALTDGADTSPLLSIRVLQLLQDTSDSGGGDAFLDVEEVVEYCEAMGISSHLILGTLDKLLGSGLCLNYDPIISDVAHASSVEISPSGRQHLRWGRGHYEYVSAMADVTPIRSAEAFDELRGIARRGGRATDEKTMRFAEYLLVEDALVCRLPDHVSYDGQRQLRVDLDRLILERKMRISERELDR